jgi:hypothetical protein
MAAEYEGRERTAEEISQLLYHLQVLMLANLTPDACTPRRRLRPPLNATTASTPDESLTMLRIAVPNKGSLSEPSAAMLREAGYRTRRDPKELIVTDAANGVELFYLRPRDIAVYVGSGTVDCGITGRDLLLDSGQPPSRCCTRLRRVHLPVCRPPGHGVRARRHRVATGWRPATRGSSRSTWPTTA